LPRPIINKRSWNHIRMMEALDNQENEYPLNKNEIFENFDGNKI
jgi:hypothetical protein